MEGQAGAVGASDAEGVRSLDQRTQLPQQAHWLARTWPQAGEASISFVGPGTKVRTPGNPDPDDLERAELNHQRANRRAIGVSRRYLVANRLTYMWVLTFEEGRHGLAGREECMRQVAAFAERVAAKFGHRAYWYSPEVHPGGHGWHVNFFVGRRIPHDQVLELWGQGHVWVKDWTRDSRVSSLRLPAVVAARLGALYGCKYAAKDWSEEVVASGAHRYEVAQGFKPDENVDRLATLAEAMAFVRATFGGHPPTESWSSNDVFDWPGLPVFCQKFSAGLDERLPGG